MTPKLTWSDDELESIYCWNQGADMVRKYNSSGEEVDAFIVSLDLGSHQNTLTQVHHAVITRIKEDQRKRNAKPVMTNQEYLAAHGNKCPFCMSTNLEGKSFDADAGMSWQRVNCLACKNSWRDEYILNSFTPYKKGERK